MTIGVIVAVAASVEARDLEPLENWVNITYSCCSLSGASQIAHRTGRAADPHARQSCGRLELRRLFSSEPHDTGGHPKTDSLISRHLLVATATALLSTYVSPHRFFTPLPCVSVIWSGIPPPILISPETIVHHPRNQCKAHFPVWPKFHISIILKHPIH